MGKIIIPSEERYTVSCPTCLKCLKMSNEKGYDGYKEHMERHMIPYNTNYEEWLEYAKKVVSEKENVKLDIKD